MMTETLPGVVERHTVYIDGAWRTPHHEDVLEVVSPWTEEVVGRVCTCDRQDVDLAVRAARGAFDEGEWPRRSVEERTAVLERAIALLEPRAPEIARIVTSELGQPITISSVGVPRALQTGRYFLDIAATVPSHEIRRGAITAAVVREPVGVVAAIAPWNGPFSMAVTKVVPALAAGCTVVFKPAPETPLDVFYLAEALAEVGLPDGVFNLVVGGRDVGEALVSHPGVDHVTFTGSTSTGRGIGAVCGQHLKRVQLELGGKSAALILEDADLDAAAPSLAFGAFYNSGQICLAFSRVLAARSRYAEVVDRLVTSANAMTLGDPFDPQTKLGPLVSRGQRDRVEAYIAAGHADGARLVRGGQRPPHLPRGWYVEPTIFADAANDQRICREEIFGPVVAVMPFDDIDEAIAIANDSDYGLHGGVFTNDADAALRIARSVRTGSFSVNMCAYNVEAPFGGMKASGVGRDTGREGFESFLEFKTINLPEAMTPYLEESRQ
jgi:acyl-CoA reductase-like NAD-dependent aldehyde dehydrogenase